MLAAAAPNERNVLRIGDAIDAANRRRSAPDALIPWRLVRFAARDHHTSRTILMREFEVYCPYAEELRAVARRHLSHAQRAALGSGNEITRQRIVRVELFPGYCFVRLELSHPRWHECFDLARVRGIVCAGNLPVAVPDELVDKVRSREVGGIVPATTTVHELLKVGDCVQFIDGPFSDFNAVVEELPDVRIGELHESARLKLAVMVFGRPTLVEVEFGSIARK